MIRAIIKTFVYGAIFISLCTVGLCMETNLLLGLPFNSFYFYLLVFSATLGQYNIHYYIKREANLDSDRFLWSLQHKKIHLILNIIGAIGLIIGLFHLKPKNFIVLGIIAAITILYSFPFLPFKKRKRLKDFGLLKIFTLSYVWTLITVWFPVITLTKVTPDFQLIFIQRFVFMFVLCLAFDIRDVESDGRKGIHTLPVVLGKRKCYQLIILSLVIFLVVSLMHFRIALHFMELIGMILSALATYFIIEYGKTKNTDMLYLAGVDGMMLLQAILIGVGSIGMH
ncbi:MAG: UbiA family prenyltransferase, partial [Chitinophagaceae bacterium]